MLSLKNNITTEAVSISVLSFAAVVIAVEVVNRNKPEKYTQEEKMSVLGVSLAVSLGMYFLTKKVFEK